MANTIAHATGYDSKRQRSEHRTGSEAARAEAATWQTLATAYVTQDGSGYVEVRRNGELLHRFEFGPEGS